MTRMSHHRHVPVWVAPLSAARRPHDSAEEVGAPQRVEEPISAGAGRKRAATSAWTVSGSPSDEMA